MAIALPPVLLIHGIDDTVEIFAALKRYLGDRGWSNIHALNLRPNNGDVGLDILAEQIRDYIDHHLADAPHLDIVGFSMGGIVARYYLQRLNGLKQVRRFITLSSPHNGTWTGYLRFNTGAAQMRPNSAFLQDLNRTIEELQQVEFTSLWTPYDLMILPVNSSRLPVGTMITVPVLAHPLMVTDQRSLKIIADLLGDRSQHQQPASATRF
ncbi:MAG: alpha/beta fold hydrolase [Cyanobacteria bacterium P01_D01_bin.71]